jgi:RNA polymerase sigma-70 factor (ECF subfamily)
MNASAIGDVYEQSRGALRAVATRLVGWHEAEDVVQDAFVNALTRHAAFRGEASPRTWVTRILINAAIDRARTIKRREWRHVPFEGIAEADGNGTPRPHPGFEDRVLLRAAMATLPRRDRQLTVLHYICGYSSVEIAHRLNMPDGTVKSRLFEVRRRLRAVACRR